MNAPVGGTCQMSSSPENGSEDLVENPPEGFFARG
jgi:hypothetical protein